MLMQTHEQQRARYWVGMGAVFRSHEISGLEAVAGSSLWLAPRCPHVCKWGTTNREQGGRAVLGWEYVMHCVLMYAWRKEYVPL